MVASIQYVATVIAFSIGKPFRKSMHTNFLFCLNIILILLVNYYVILCPDDFTKNFLDVFFIVLVYFRYNILVKYITNQ